MPPVAGDRKIGTRMNPVFPSAFPERAGMWRGIVRNLHMLRHVPSRQILRRLVLRAAERVEPWRGTGRAEVTGWAERFPEPPLPRRELGRWEEDRLWVYVSWGWREFPWPPPWRPVPPRRESDSSDFARLHYMEYLESLPEDVVPALIEAWIAGNPRRRPGALRFSWRPYNLSIRVVSWLQEIARRRREVANDRWWRIRDSLVEQLALLERFLETDIRGNHIVRNIRALLWGGAMLRGPAAERWRRLGSALLEAELEEQILPDGVHYERSPSYHCQVLGDFLDCRAVLGPGPLRERLDERLREMMRALPLLTHPDGRVALFNDASLTMARFPDELERGYEALLGPPPAPPRGAFALPEAGYFGWRGESELFILDCGPLGPDYLIGHGHCDMLSFEWSVGGRRIVVDQGVYQYLPDRRRHISRGTAFHNTLAVEGAEQSDIYGAFRCGRRARAELLQFEKGEGGFRFHGRHDGFRILPGAPLHERLVERSGEGAYRIRDRLTADPGRRAAIGLLLHPDCEIERSAPDRLRIRRSPVVVEIRADAPIAIEEAVWYPDLFLERPSRRLRVPIAPPPGQRLIELRPLSL